MNEGMPNEMTTYNDRKNKSYTIKKNLGMPLYNHNKNNKIETTSWKQTKHINCRMRTEKGDQRLKSWSCV